MPAPFPLCRDSLSLRCHPSVSIYSAYLTPALHFGRTRKKIPSSISFLLFHPHQSITSERKGAFSVSFVLSSTYCFLSCCDKCKFLNVTFRINLACHSIKLLLFSALRHLFIFFFTKNSPFLAVMPLFGYPHQSIKLIKMISALLEKLATALLRMLSGASVAQKLPVLEASAGDGKGWARKKKSRQSLVLLFSLTFTLWVWQEPV